jgi:hypothetical protein
MTGPRPSPRRWPGWAARRSAPRAHPGHSGDTYP